MAEAAAAAPKRLAAAAAPLEAAEEEEEDKEAEEEPTGEPMAAKLSLPEAAAAAWYELMAKKSDWYL